LRGFVEFPPHMADDFQTESLGLGGLAMMNADQGFKTFGQADESEREGAMLQHIPDFVVRSQFVRVEPDAVAHQEREVTDFFAALDFEPVQQLIDAQGDRGVQSLVKIRDAAATEQAEPGQIDRREAEIAAPGDDFPRRIVDVADDPGPAAHIGDFGFRLAGFVVLQIERGIEKREIGEQPLGADPAGELEQVVVRVARVIVDSFLQFEDLDRKNRCLAITEPGFGRQHDVFHYHAAFGGRVGAVINGAERHLGAGAAMHGVQVMDQGLHGLIGQAVGFLQRLFPGETLGLREERGIKTIGEKKAFFRFVAIVAVDFRSQIPTVGEFLDYAAHFERDFFRGIGGEFQSLDQVFPVFVREGFANAVRQGVIEVRNALAAVLVVLVRLDGDAGQRRVTGDVVGLAQEPMAGRKTVLEQFLNIDLTAGRGQRVKIKIVDMDVAILMGFGMLRLQDIHFIVNLGAFRAVF